MRRCTLSLILSALILLIPATAAFAAKLPAGAKWEEATIQSTDGVKLHADILRPANLPADAKTPVILSIGPYFNHSGQVGAAGPAQGGVPYDPVSTSEGPSERFHDLIEGAKLMERGYTVVMVDLRGFGGSTGCLDWGGPGEQADVVKAVEWAAGQSWSNGNVGMYGKSYDAVTGLVGVNLAPKGLKAVVAQEPVYDLYRYLYGDGIRRSNSALTPALYDAIAATPGPLGDGPAYFADSVNDPACLGTNWLEQAADENHDSDYWKARNLIPGAAGSDVPLFLTQGLTENNTVPDGMTEYLENHTGYERAWLGPWDHVRGAETDEDGRLLMGRRGWYDEVIRFYDRFLKGEQPSVEDPMVAVQTNDGRWRGEEIWPPADAERFASGLRAGEYQDTGKSFSTGSDDSATSGVWTISPPVPHDAHLAGSGKAVLDLDISVPRANVAVDVYDIGPDGTGPLVSRQARLVPESGRHELTLWSADWKIAAGHRIAVRVTDTNLEYWLGTIGTMQPVGLTGGSIDLPFLKFKRTETIQGDPGPMLEDELEDVVELSPELIAESESKDFVLPPAMVDRPAPASDRAQSSPANSGAAAATPAAQRKPRVTSRLRALPRGRIRVSGSAPSGSRLVVRLRRAGRTVAAKRVTARRGRYAVTFRVRRAGRYAALVKGAAQAQRVRVTARAVRVRLR